ncbi:hypothetical protein [Actinoplanes sp. NBRC 101535]|uniref:hypothetical protein n=1 Tax=Actinoplanes sp. NBRC 101535 TaxID=3032196 RepID=UPI0024A36AFA|nr:hypothetical protein [Actinoplanes sp. NBRC 101535]GLY08325.1 hypothetical protein Acsp01_87040 [Actinoplanes sp. NBRC 101535]
MPDQPYRVGGSWGTTIVRTGTGPADDRGRRPDDKLVAVTLHDDRALAELIVGLLNDHARRDPGR